MRMYKSGAIMMVLAGAAMSCGGNPYGDGTVGSIDLAVTTIPTGVTCVQLVISGSTSATQKFTVVAGGSSVLNLGPLAPGTVTINGTAYNVACASVTALNATWTSDAVATAVSAGLVSNINLTFRPNSSTNATVDFVPPAVCVSGGYTSSYAVMAGGTARAWGQNSNGQLGDGTTTSRLKPVSVSGLATAKKIAGGESHACALLADGSIRCWGNNAFGQLGDNTTTQRNAPVALSGVGGIVFTQIAAGNHHTCALSANGNVYCWGGNSVGQLGDGTTTSHLVPTLSNKAGAVEVRCGTDFTCASDQIGTGYCWGQNAQGNFGNGSTNSSSPQPSITQFLPIVGLGTFQADTCALTPLGTMLCSGYNDRGVIGDGTTTQRLVPTAVSGLTNIVAMATGATSYTPCAVRGDGLVFCWGFNFYGAIGNGTKIDQLAPVQVVGLTGAVAAAVGGEHGCALRTDGSVYCWGYNGNGQIGDGTTISRYTAAKVAF